MPYSKQTWVDEPSRATPLSAARLNYMEDGIGAALPAETVGVPNGVASLDSRGMLPVAQRGEAPINVNDYGAKGDGVRVRGVTASTGSAVVTFTGTSFTPADAGKLAVVYSDTAAGTITTIQSVESATSITLAANAGIDVSGTAGYFIYGTDDSAAITSALSAAQASASVDTTVGPNQPQGLGKPVVVIPRKTSGSLYLLRTAVTVPSGVTLDCVGMVVNLLSSRTTPAVVFASYSGSPRFTMEAMFGDGVQLGSATGSQADVHMGTVVVWHVGRTPGQDALSCLGWGFLIDLFWCKGGDRGIVHAEGSDFYCNRAFIIGARTGITMTQSNQVRYNSIILDTNGDSVAGRSGIVLDNACSDISFHVQAFCVTPLTRILDNVVLVGNGSVNKNVYLRFNVMAQRTGGNVVNFQQAQDVECTVLASNTSSNSSGGANLTTAVVFGTVAGSFRCSAELNGTVTPYSGNVSGAYRYTRGGVEYSVQGGAVATGTALAANGTTPPAPTVTGNDQRGNILFGSGAAPTAGAQMQVTFASGNAWVTTPFVLLTAQNQATAALQPFVASVSTTGFMVGFATAPAASQPVNTYQLHFSVEG